MKLIVIAGGIGFGVVIGFTVSRLQLQFDNRNSALTREVAPIAVESAEQKARRLFPEISPLDIYKNSAIIDILREPHSVALYPRRIGGAGVEVGGFHFSEAKHLLAPNDASAISLCFRSINAIEVGFGYPCVFDPDFLIRFRSQSGLEVVDFLCEKDCYIFDWYFNEKRVDDAVSRFKMNCIGESIVKSISRSSPGESCFRVSPE